MIYFFWRFIGIVWIAVAWLCPWPAGAALNLDETDHGRYNSVRVDRVLNADTIVLENGETISLIGVRAWGEPPQRKKIERDEYGFVIEKRIHPEISREEKAIMFVRELLEDKDVRLEFDSAPTDEDYRTMAYVFVIDTEIFANVEILRRGFGDLHIQPPNMKYAQQLRAAYHEGRIYDE